MERKLPESIKNSFLRSWELFQTGIRSGIISCWMNYFRILIKEGE